MSVKSEILKMLYEKETVSGEVMAGQLGVSRNAIWKAITALREEGFSIDAVTNRGYVLVGSGDALSAAAISSLLRPGMEWDIETRKEVSSTNTVVKELAENGAREGKVIIASSQTAGKGRMGRSFSSPEGCGLYMSVLLRPVFPAEQALFITTLASVCVSRAIEAAAGADTSIKWVNDVFCRGKKVCGILTEASLDMESGGLSYAVLGMGINIKDPPGGWPEELAPVAGSLFGAAEPPRGARNLIAAHILNGLAEEYGELESRRFLSEYRSRSALLGKPVTMYVGKHTFDGVAVDIDSEARLIVRLNNGEMRAFSSGEARARKKGDIIDET